MAGRRERRGLAFTGVDEPDPSCVSVSSGSKRARSYWVLMLALMHGDGLGMHALKPDQLLLLS